MESKVLEETDPVLDLESGSNVSISEEEGSDSGSFNNGQAKYLLKRFWSGYGSTKGDEAVKWGNKSSRFLENHLEKGEALANRRLDRAEVGALSEKTVISERSRRKASRKPPKPPRPPKSQSLDVADQKLVKEISDLAKFKRIRLDRVKAFKKRRSSRQSSSYTSMCAMIVTILFCVILIWQAL